METSNLSTLTVMIHVNVKLQKLLCKVFVLSVAVLYLWLQNRVSQAPPVVEQACWQDRHRGTPSLSTACRYPDSGGGCSSSAVLQDALSSLQRHRARNLLHFLNVAWLIFFFFFFKPFCALNFTETLP